MTPEERRKRFDEMMDAIHGKKKLTEEELQEKFDKLTNLAHEEMFNMFREYADPEKVAQFRQILAITPIVYRELDPQIGGFTNGHEIVINKSPVKSCNMNSYIELNRVLHTIIHEYGHRFRKTASKNAGLFEEGAANLFAEICINYWAKDHDTGPDTIYFRQASTREYEKGEDQVRTILYVLKQKDMDITTLCEYIYDGEENFVDKCSQVFGDDFEEYYEEAKKMRPGHIRGNRSEEMLTKMVVRLIQEHKISLKDYQRMAELYTFHNPIICRAIVEAGKEALLDDEKELYDYFVEENERYKEIDESFDRKERDDIKQIINGYNLSDKTAQEIYDIILEVCSSYTQKKEITNDQTVHYLSELKKLIPNIDEFTEKYRKLRELRQDDKILDNMDLEDISFDKIFAKMESMLPQEEKEQMPTEEQRTQDLAEMLYNNKYDGKIADSSLKDKSI